MNKLWRFVLKEKVGIEKINGRFQVDEGVFDIIKTIITGKNDPITTTPDSKLSKKGKELKRAAIAYKNEIEADAKKKGVDAEEEARANLKKLGIKF